MEAHSMLPDNFREINIWSETDELKDGHVPFLRKNIVVGRYDGIDHYLDIQFRLLHEDFARPLRESIIEYIRTRNEPKKKSQSNVYKSVDIRRQGRSYICKFGYDLKVCVCLCANYACVTRMHFVCSTHLGRRKDERRVPGLLIDGQFQYGHLRHGRQDEKRWI